MTVDWLEIANSVIVTAIGILLLVGNRPLAEASDAAGKAAGAVLGRPGPDARQGFWIARIIVLMMGAMFTGNGVFRLARMLF